MVSVHISGGTDAQVARVRTIVEDALRAAGIRVPEFPAPPLPPSRKPIPRMVNQRRMTA